jgi:hypothetical protein
VLDEDDDLVLDLGRSDWADWSQSGELLFAREGRVHRAMSRADGSLQPPEELIDLRSLRFEQVPPPPDALSWNSKVTGRRIK